MSELEYDLTNYEYDTSVGNYYYQAIAKISWILTYMQYNIKYNDKDDPLFTLNLALYNLFGHMILDQGKTSVLNHIYEIRSTLNEITSANRERRYADRDAAIQKFYGFLRDNLSIDEEDKNQDDNKIKVPLEEVPKIIIPESNEERFIIDPKEFFNNE